MCRDYADERASFVQHGHDQNGLGLAPFDPRHNSTAVLVGDDLYAGTVADFVGVDSIIFRTPLRTQQFDSVQLNSPDFVGSFAHEVSFSHLELHRLLDDDFSLLSTGFCILLLPRGRGREHQLWKVHFL